jgi:hypothetical protein
MNQRDRSIDRVRTANRCRTVTYTREGVPSFEWIAFVRERSANESITERFDSPHSKPLIRSFEEVSRMICVWAKHSKRRKFLDLREGVLRFGARQVTLVPASSGGFAMFGRETMIDARLPHRSFNEIMIERRDGPPCDPSVATQSFVYALACELIRREAGRDRAETVVADFNAAASDFHHAAMNGATYHEQAQILQRHWKDVELPPADFRKRRVRTGPDGKRLRAEYKELHPLVTVALCDRKWRPFDHVERSLQGLAPDNTDERTLRSAARETPSRATHILLAQRHGIGPDTVKNRINAEGERE